MFIYLFIQLNWVRKYISVFRLHVIQNYQGNLIHIEKILFNYHKNFRCGDIESSCFYNFHWLKSWNWVLFTNYKFQRKQWWKFELFLSWYRMSLCSSEAEHWSRKPGVVGSIPIGGSFFFLSFDFLYAVIFSMPLRIVKM